MTTTCECGAAVPATAQWCSLCHRPVPDARFVPVAGPDAADTRPVRVDTTVSAQVRERRSAAAPVGRFAKTDVTFGLRGRIVMSLLVLLPFWFFLKNFVTGGWVGVVILGAVGLPWAFRDIWRRSDRL